MAKDIERDDDVNKMDDESLGFLDQVRKGKSRNFVLSVKGVKVRSLLVKKKSLKAADKKEARGSGYEPVFGVVTGKGPEIRFQICTKDGFAEPPGGGKTLKLKKFLEEQTGKKFKPEYEVVAELPDVTFDEEDLRHPLVAKFMKLTPVIAKAIETRPDQQTEIEQRRDEISDDLAEPDTRDQAGSKLDQFVEYLKQLLAGGETQPAPPPATDDGERQKLMTALNKMTPLVKQAVVADPNRKTEILTPVAEIKRILEDANTTDFAAARQLLMDLGRSLQDAASTPSAPPAPDESGERQNLMAALNKMTPLIKQAITEHPDRRQDVLGPVAELKSALEDDVQELGDAKSKLLELGRLLQSLAASGPSTEPTTEQQPGPELDPVTGIPKGIVKQRQFLVTRFKEIPLEIKPHLETMRDEIAKLVPDEDVSDLVGAIEDELQLLYDELREEIDESINAGDPGRLKGLKQRVMNHELLSHLADSPLSQVDGGQFQAAVISAIEEVEQNLAG